MSVPQETIERDDEEEEKDRVLGCFGTRNSIRQSFLWLGRQPLFDFVIYSAIIISCVFLMMAPPNDELAMEEGILDLDQVCVCKRERAFVRAVCVSEDGFSE